MKFNKRLIFFLVISVLGISFSFYAYQMVYTPNILVDQDDRLLLVKEGDTFKDVQEELHDGNFVQDLISFSFLAKLMNYDEQIKPGRYLLKRNMSNLRTIQLLKSGAQEPVRITFNNVRLIPELAEKITRNLGMTPQEFEAAVVQFAINNSNGLNKDNVLVMFIPNTYQVYYNIVPEALVKRMYQEYENFWTDERKEKAKKIGLTRAEVSVLASIVQAESIREDEAPTIAGLYMNRLKQGIPLQADPTLVFAVGDFTLKRILDVHKENDSPYNTYKYAGLPPGPINMPEINSLEAVLNFKPSDYLYMCAKEDFSGRHNFTSDYKEHMNNAIRYQKALTIEQRKGAALKKR
jgi:UPF0755 protein